MRGSGKYQMAQMKQRDARIFALCQHLRSAVDILEEIASAPYLPPEKPMPEPVAIPPSVPPSLPPEKQTYSIKEASKAIGIGTSTLYKHLATGELSAVKLGGRTLIRAEVLRQWLAALPAARR